MSTNLVFTRRQFLTLGGAALAGSVLGSIRPLTALAKDAPAAAGEFTLPALPYAVNALEPHIDAATMEIHHGKHHAAYVKNLNEAVAKENGLRGKSLKALLSDLNAVPANVRAAVRNNGGGHYNHRMFWNLMSPQGGGKPAGDLMKAIKSSFGSFESFVEGFSDAAMKRFGSGWAWLVMLPDGKLTISSTPNQDCPLMTGVVEVTGKPLLGLDVWEHAYYLKYQNRRADYVKAWWNVVNWDKVAARHQDDKED